jgi:hypothetical protein
MGLFDWLFGKRQSNDVSGMLAQQEALLSTEEHWRAFSPDPRSDLYPLKVGASNHTIHARIRENRFTLCSINTMKPVPISAFSGGFLLFGTIWDAYTAVAIGTIKKQIDTGYTRHSWGIVMVDESEEAVAARIADAWYKQFVHVLGIDSKALISAVGGTPFRVDFSDDGKVRRIMDGVYCTQNLQEVAG